MPLSERPRVVFLLESLELGGAERQAVLLARELLSKHNVDVSIWALRDDRGVGQTRRVEQLCREYGIPLTRSPVAVPDDWYRWPVALFSLARAMRRAQPTVLLPYWNKPNIAAALVWRRTGARTCIWGQRDEGRLRPPRYLEALAVASTPWFISNSDVGASFLRETLGVSDQRISVIPNGVQPALPIRSKQQWRAALGVDAADLVVMMVANIHPFKDHATLLLAWRIFRELWREHEPMAKPWLVLAGRQHEQPCPVHALAEQLGIASSVIFTGHVEDISGLFEAVDVVAHSSDKEGLPNAILEGMFFSRPIVATDIPGSRQALGEAASQHLVPPRNPEAFARCLMEICLLPPAGRIALGERNRSRAVSVFGIQRLGEATLLAIQKALLEKSPRKISVLPTFISLALRHPRIYRLLAKFCFGNAR